MSDGPRLVAEFTCKTHLHGEGIEQRTQQVPVAQCSASEIESAKRSVSGCYDVRYQSCYQQVPVVQKPQPQSPPPNPTPQKQAERFCHSARCY